MIRTPVQWRYYVLEAVDKAKSNMACVVRDQEILAQGPEAADLLQGNVTGAALYTFCEPGTAVCEQAAAAGIIAIHCVCSYQDVDRLIAAGCNFKPVVRCADAVLSLIPQIDAVVRREAFRCLGVHGMQSVNTVEWLERAAQGIAQGVERLLVVRGDQIVAEGDEIWQCDVKGGILYIACEPDVRMLARAKAVGIVAVYCALSQHDACRLGIFGPVLEPIKHQAYRRKIVAELEQQHGK